MFVSQAKFDEEHRLRIIAETRLEDSRQEVERLREMLNLERTDRAADNLAHRNQLTDLLDRYEPKPEKSAFGNPAELTNRTAAEILAMPATNRREMALRTRLYNEALRTERLSATKNFDQSQPTAPVGGLNEKEKAHIDTILEGIAEAAHSN